MKIYGLFLCVAVTALKFFFNLISINYNQYNILSEKVVKKKKNMPCRTRAA